MTDVPVRILVVEDSEPDYDLLCTTLARQGVAARTERVETREQMAAALRRERWDAVISDHQLPQFSSLEALRTLHDSGSQLPFIIVSGTIGEDVAVEAMRSGADDFLIKGRLARLGAALERALASAAARRERAAAQAALAESERRLHELSAHLQAAIEDERRSIAREIHDDVGGMLTALRFDLGWIERHGDVPVAQRARQALETVTQVMQASQRIMRNLRPPVLEAGVVAAVEWQVAQFRKRTGTAATFETSVERLELDERAALTVYRTVQEALTNVVKHAGASRVGIGLVLRDGLLSLEIADDGAGPAAGGARTDAAGGGFGLRGLAERARAAGGWLEVLPGERGLTVLLTLPVVAGARDAQGVTGEDAQRGVAAEPGGRGAGEPTGVEGR